jgi:hypothetical protein
MRDDIEDHPYRHISSLNFIERQRNPTFESSMTPCEMSPSLGFESDEKQSKQADISVMTNAIKINHSRSSSESTVPIKHALENSVQKNISYTSQSNYSACIEKENAQPNSKLKDIPGHTKTNTVICYSTDESQKYQLEQVLKACIDQNHEGSFLESSFLYKTEQSNFGNYTERGPRNEISISPDTESLIKSLQDSLK